MNKTTAIAVNSAKSFKADPAGSVKALFFLALALLVLFVLYKVFKGIGKATELIGDLAPSTDAEKAETISGAGYQSALLWLGDRKGVEEIARSKRFLKFGPGKQVSTYLGAIKYPFENLSKVADQIADAKLPVVGFYVNATEVMNAIGSLPTKATISLMAGRFNDLHGKGLTGYPLHTYLSKYLSLGEMNALAKIINSKPDL